MRKNIVNNPAKPKTMKYLLSIFTVIFLFSCKTTKITNKEIIIDFASPTYPDVEIIKPKQNLVITLKNINPYLYDISVKDSIVVNSVESPTLFGQVFKIPELNPTPTEAPSTDPKVASAMPKDGSIAGKEKEKEKALDEDLKKFIAGYASKEIDVKDLLTLAKISDDISKLLYDCYSSITDLKSKADTYIKSKIENLPDHTLPIGIQSQITKETNDIKQALNTYASSGGTLKNKLQAILDQSDPNLTLAEYKSIEKDIKEKIALIDKILENIKSLSGKVKDFEDAKVGTAIEDSYNKIMTSRISKTFITPTQYRTDEVFLTIEAKKKKEVFCTQEIGKIPITAIVFGGVKIDFSTGLVFNFGNKKFFDQNYYYDSVNRVGTTTLADSVSIKRSRNNNVSIPSLGVFMHIYSRLNSHINFGGVIGTSLGTDQRAYYHLGASLLLGKSDRLIISGGVSLANGKTLDGKYSENQMIKRSLAPQSIPTENGIRAGGFLSISWNLNLIK